ncbi:MAG: ribosome small subunit-dependent GTPase A, partial [Desulfocapsa sp.]|nr:ribosome small subunit-dependent GTPase A [Desulfocapsa sp.]
SDGVNDNFDDVSKLARSCRFSNCRHTNEPGCAILKAIEEGDLQSEHYQNFVKLKMESENNEISYIVRKKKKKRY